MITVVRAGPLTTIQDQGRPAYGHLGVPRSGALDGPALRRANALVGNPIDAAGLETTLMGCALRFERGARVAVTGAVAVVKVDKEPVSGVIDVPAGSVLEVGRATRGVRSYVAVQGGIDVEPVLGSRSTDTLSGLGPPKLVDGTELAIGVGAEPVPRPGLQPDARSRPNRLNKSDLPDAPSHPSRLNKSDLSEFDEISDELELGVWVGPRDDWFEGNELFENPYTVSPMSNRVGCRLGGEALRRSRPGELPPEGMVLGAIQVPADGQPLIFLADHPTTGGYPVIGVVDDVTPLAQARPGSTVRFRAFH
ncbi:biotin-dependent carboxyltransferase family protein [Paractinoplanes lichenicola]|uniref:Biotin-dependent carboxyltransferase family protein n=1 Tax=Paractinoplanes lichenicola TaxID=2802976 RepID=A0ABS1W1Y8_9ACTN|nr:biotin-dependent carboxyltransferase family protein [Actinoplanes lichenicola]MBL7260737.1 biotin-dependent carboxyltransferase family protein [Actinoplanes lichenicola]